MVNAYALAQRTESNMIHKFNLPISLLIELQSFGGPQVLVNEGSWLGNNNGSLTHTLKVKSGVSLDLPNQNRGYCWMPSPKE